MTPGFPTDTLADLFEQRAVESATTSYLEDARSDRVFDYAGFAVAVDAWSAVFAGLGIPSGGAVLVSHADPLSFAVVHLAAIAAGRRSIPLAPDLASSELQRISDLLGGASLVVSDRGAVVDGAASAFVFESTGFPSDVRAGEAAPRSPGPTHGGAAVLFTSGSTGEPKGVELSERQLLFVAREIAGNNALVAGDRGFNSLPLFHVNAEVVGLLSTLVAGATLVLDASFHRTGFWELIAARRITWLNAVPAMLAVLTRGGSSIPNAGLRFIRSASAPLPDAVRDALGDVPLVVSWGMTEGASQITATPLGVTARPGSVGVPLGSEVAVRDENGTTLAPGEVGALWVRGPGIVSSYLFGRASDRFDSDGWLSTGDLGSVDSDGWVYLVGRSDDVINRGGEKVYPAELEEVLLGDARVLEAVVVGRPDDVLGHVPVAYVIAAPGSDSNDSLVDDLAERARVALPRFKRPMQITVVPDFPRAPTGKVQRARLRELAAESMS